MTSKEALVGASFESQGCDSTAKATGKARKREWATCADPIFLYYWPAARRYAAALPADALTPLAYSGSRRRCEGSAYVEKPGKAVSRGIPLATALQTLPPGRAHRDAAPAISECGGKRYSARHRSQADEKQRIV